MQCKTRSKTRRKPLYANPLPSSIRTQIPQILSKLPQKYRSRNAKPNRDKRKHTIPPSIIKSAIHIGCKKREPKARKRSHKCRGRKRTRRKPRIRVDQIRLNTLVRDNNAHSEERRADVGGYPMAVSLSCPAVDEEAGWSAKCTYEEEGNAEFGTADVLVLAF